MTTSLPSLENWTSISTASARCRQARWTEASVFSGASCEAPRWAMISIPCFQAPKELLLRQPFFPVPGEIIHVGPRDWNQGADVLRAGRVFFEMDFVDEMFDRTI